MLLNRGGNRTGRGVAHELPLTLHPIDLLPSIPVGPVGSPTNLPPRTILSDIQPFNYAN